MAPSETVEKDDAATRTDENANANLQSVNPRPIVSVFPSQLSLAVGASGECILTISEKPQRATEIKISQDQPGVVEIPPFVSIPAGEFKTTVTMKRITAGSTTVNFSLNESTNQASLHLSHMTDRTLKPWWQWRSSTSGNPTPLNKRLEDIQRASNSLLGSFLILLFLFLGLYGMLRATNTPVTLAIVLLFGALGSFLAQQRRLRELSDEDLELFHSSTIYKWLSPIAGATLAGILYLIFIGKLLAGELFPDFDLPSEKDALTNSGIVIIFDVASTKPSAYAKLLFWSFLAGYSERFVTDIIGRFESQAQPEAEEARDRTGVPPRTTET